MCYTVANEEGDLLVLDQRISDAELDTALKRYDFTDRMIGHLLFQDSEQERIADECRKLSGDAYEKGMLDLADIYAKRADNCFGRHTEILEEIETLKKDLPCRDFLLKFGIVLHEYYKRAYPINHETVVQKSLRIGDVIIYPLPMQIASIEPTDLLSLAMSYQVGQTEWRLWANASARRIYWLAFASEINTVYWANREDRE
jgi:hypothetical protein